MIFFLFLFGGVGYSVFSTQFYFEFIKDFESLTKQILYTILYYLPLAALIVCMHNFKLLRVNSTDKIYLKIIKKTTIVFTFFCLLLVKTSIKYQNWNLEKLVEFFSQFFQMG